MTSPTCNDTGYVAVVAKDETGPVLDAPCTCTMGRVQRLREQVNTLTLQRDGLCDREQAAAGGARCAGCDAGAVEARHGGSQEGNGAASPGRAVMRYLSWKEATTPRRFDKQLGKWICRGCQRPIERPGKQSWCSRECEERTLIKCGLGVRYQVERRDHGVCAICGVDTIWLRELWKYHLRDAMPHREWMDLGRMLSGLMRPSREWWDADHIRPVVEGGGGCGLDNLRTLCVPCHKADTAALAAKRAAERRASKAVLFAAREAAGEGRNARDG